jgi:UV DNA damage repair endonuclease
MRLATYLAETGHERLVELTAQNTADLLTILEWNAKNEIYLFRLSSEVRASGRSFHVSFL